MVDLARPDETAPHAPFFDELDGALAALADSAAHEIMDMSEEEAAHHLLLSSIRQVVSLYESDAPDFLIDLANQRMHRNLRRLRERRRAMRTSVAAGADDLAR